MIDIYLIIVLIALISYPLWFTTKLLYFARAKAMMVQREYMNNALGRIATFDKLMVDKMKKMKDNQDNGGDNVGYA